MGNYSLAYSRAMCKLREIHREEFDELLAATRVEVEDEDEAHRLTVEDFLLARPVSAGGVVVYEEADGS